MHKNRNVGTQKPSYRCWKVSKTDSGMLQLLPFFLQSNINVKIKVQNSIWKTISYILGCSSTFYTIYRILGHSDGLPTRLAVEKYDGNVENRALSFTDFSRRKYRLDYLRCWYETATTPAVVSRFARNSKPSDPEYGTASST